MKNRMWGLAALGSLLLSSMAFAGNCKSMVLYENGSSAGRMEESTRSFPEAPEWSANWGDFEGIKSPYIRLSGMRNYRSDWTGSLVFDALPATVQGGSLRLKVRSTQAGNLGVWLSGAGGNGKISFHALAAGKAQSLEIPVAELLGEGSVEVDKVGIGLFGVPANQYTTLFVDDIELTCVQEGGEGLSDATAASDGRVGGGETAATFAPYDFADINPASPVREGLFEYTYERPVKSRYTTSERQSLMGKTKARFVIPEESHLQILNFKNAGNLSPQNSWRGWYSSLFLVEKGKLEEGTIPNSKRIFEEAEMVAAAADYTTLPVLFADVDYGVAYCGDSACAHREIGDYRLTLVGFPTPYVRGSVVRLVYDPYFTVVPGGKLPRLEFCTAGKCLELNSKTEGILEFGSAGTQEVQVKIHLENQTVEQKLYVEVR